MLLSSDVYTDHNPFNILIHKSIYNTAPLRKFIDKSVEPHFTTPPSLPIVDIVSVTGLSLAKLSSGQ